jgi:LacI family transcriptional regulator
LVAGSERLEGFLARAGELGIDVPGEYIEHGDFFHASGVEAMQRLLALPTPPTAVFAASDEMAIGALRAILDAGLHVPGDVSVLGIDDLESAALVRPTLSTLAQDHLALGRTIVGRLTALIERRRAQPDHDPIEAEPTLLPTRLLIRESTGPAPE